MWWTIHKLLIIFQLQKHINLSNTAYFILYVNILQVLVVWTSTNQHQ